jgi:hypothetical protein
MDEATQEKSGGFKWQYITWPFAIIGVLGLAFVTLAAVTLFSFDRPISDPVVAVQEDGKAIAFQLGGIQRLPGTLYWAVQVHEERGDDVGSYGKGYDRDIRNVLLLEEATGKSVRLLPTHDQKIATVSYWSKTGPVDDHDEDAASNAAEAAAAGARPQTQNAKATAVYYIMFVQQPEDGKVRQVMIIGDIATQDHDKVLNGLSEVEQFWSIGPEKMAVLARKDGALFYYIIDMANRKIVLTQKVAI